MRRALGNSLKLGIVDGTAVPLEMTPQMRSTHLYICGSTGTGKSKMLESLVRQYIKNWHKSKCGALIIDPHGSLSRLAMVIPHFRFYVTQSVTVIISDLG
jgi:putative protein kinase ArgK-like GTPase of G3E family